MRADTELTLLLHTWWCYIVDRLPHLIFHLCWQVFDQLPVPETNIIVFVQFTPSYRLSAVDWLSSTTSRSSRFWTQFSLWSNCVITLSLMHWGPKHFSSEADVVKEASVKQLIHLLGITTSETRCSLSRGSWTASASQCHSAAFTGAQRGSASNRCPALILLPKPWSTPSSLPQLTTATASSIAHHPNSSMKSSASSTLLVTTSPRPPGAPLDPHPSTDSMHNTPPHSYTEMFQYHFFPPKTDSDTCAVGISRYQVPIPVSYKMYIYLILRLHDCDMIIMVVNPL